MSAPWPVGVSRPDRAVSPKRTVVDTVAVRAALVTAFAGNARRRDRIGLAEPLMSAVSCHRLCHASPVQMFVALNLGQFGTELHAEPASVRGAVAAHPQDPLIAWFAVAICGRTAMPVIFAGWQSDLLNLPSMDALRSAGFAGRCEPLWVAVGAPQR